MTLVCLATVVALVVALILWDIHTQSRRNARAVVLAWDRGYRRAEDQAWANRQAEYELAMLITHVNAEIASVDALVRTLARVRHLEVVA